VEAIEFDFLLDCYFYFIVLGEAKLILLRLNFFGEGGKTYGKNLMAHRENIWDGALHGEANTGSKP